MTARTAVTVAASAAATTWAAIGGRAPGPDMIAWFEVTEAGRAAVGARGARATTPGMSGYDSPGVVGGFR